MKGEEERTPFAFAGVWREFNGNYGGEDRELITSSVIITTPIDLVRDTHPDRMPAIVFPDNYQEWLSAEPEAAFVLI